VGEVTGKYQHENRRESKGWWRNNVFIERFWKSVKYEDIYLKAYRAGLEKLDGCISEETALQ
jgi:hypothetical protein